MKGRVISLHGVLRSKRFKWTLAAAAVLLAIGIITGVILWETRGGVTADRPEVTEIFGVPVHTVFIPETLPGRPGIKREVKFIVIHETGNPSEGADAKAHSDYLLNGGEGTTSWHYTVDDHEIYHHIPDSEVSWNAGDRRQEPVSYTHLDVYKRQEYTLDHAGRQFPKQGAAAETQPAA